MKTGLGFLTCLKLAVDVQAADNGRCGKVDWKGLNELLIQRSADEGHSLYVRRSWYGLTLEQKESTARAWGYSNYEK